MYWILKLCLILFAIPGFSQPVDQIVYKEVNSTELTLDIYYPTIVPGLRYPAMVFFFGGGWKSGNINQFLPHAKYFSSRGIVCFLADYRVSNRHGTTPFESLKDARSAIRFIIKNASQFQIDTSKIIASGGSAGGHLAAATALAKGYDEDSDDLSVDCTPNALVLFNPVIDNGPGGYGYERVGEAYRDFSPLHNIYKGAPPTIFFLGTEDKLIPVETAKYYQKVMEKVGSICELHLFDGEGHGFFNFDQTSNYRQTIYQTDLFLNRLGFIAGKPAISLE